MTTLDRLNDLYQKISDRELKHIQIIVSGVSRSLVDDLIGLSSEISFDLQNQITDAVKRFSDKYGDDYSHIYLRSLHDIMKKEISKRIPVIQITKCFEEAYGNLRTDQ